MSTFPRVAGKRGRLPAKPRALGYLSTYLKSPLPSPVYPVDVSAGITAWGMLANGPDPTCTTYPDGVGDCTFAGRQHNRLAKAAAAHLTETWETSNELVAEYLAYDHGQDDGAEISALLLSWFDAGKILAFAPVDHTNPAEVDSAMAAFHGLYCGVSLTDDADELFSQGEAWGLGSITPDPDDGHCMVPGVRILTDDLHWVPVEELRVGDGLVGFDEDAGVGRRMRRKYRRAVVEASQELVLPSCEVEFANGLVVTCSGDHRWLTRNGHLTAWTRTDQLRPGASLVSRPLDTWRTDASRDAGYLAAAFDGEGWLSRSTGTTANHHGLGFAQRENALLDKVREALKERGFVFSDLIHHKPQPENFTRSDDIHTLSIQGAGRRQKRPEVLRFLGSIRPLRLLDKYSPDTMGSVFYDPWLPVTRVTPVGDRTVVALQTSSRTYLAEGFLAHNCILKVRSDGRAVDTWVTWGALQESTLLWTRRCLDEAWALVTTDDEAAKVEMPALLADINALHGTEGKSF